MGPTIMLPAVSYFRIVSSLRRRIETKLAWSIKEKALISVKKSRGKLACRAAIQGPNGAQTNPRNKKQHNCLQTFARGARKQIIIRIKSLRANLFGSFAAGDW